MGETVEEGDIKKCKVCNTEKPITEFYFRKDRGIYRPNCKKCKPLNRMSDIMNRVKNQKTKVCKHCKEEKNVTEYQKAGGGKWFQPYCKPCDAIRKEKHREENIEHVIRRRKEYYNKNSEIIREKSKLYTELNKSKVLERKRMYAQKNKIKKGEVDKKYQSEHRNTIREKNRLRRAKNSEFYKQKSKISRDNKTESQKERIREWTRQWRVENRDKVIANREKNREVRREKNRVYSNYKSATDIEFKILKNLRGRTRFALKKWDTIKSDTTEKLLGCSIPFFKNYFSSLFTQDMSWDLFMKGEIHIDHKMPCVSFDLREELQQRKCFHYTNLQPLWKLDNLKKGTSLEPKKAA